MSQPEWRLGSASATLALAGYWVAACPVTRELREAGRERAIARGEAAVVVEPHLILEGSIAVVEERVGSRPKHLLRLASGTLIAPLGASASPAAGVHFDVVADALVLTLPTTQLIGVASGNPETAGRLLEGMSLALRQQRWLMQLAAHTEPLDRLRTLLLRITEDIGRRDELGWRLDGVPDVRELAVLAGISRENAVIDLSWLVHSGALRWQDGRLWVLDLEALRVAAPA